MDNCIIENRVSKNSEISTDKEQVVEDNNNIDCKSFDKPLECNGNELNTEHNIETIGPIYLPQHLMGRDLNDPSEDLIGTRRCPQKPRLGVKVPYRNLTSQIVTQEEIAQELIERSTRNYNYTELPQKGNTLFAMKLTHRLANKITEKESSELLSDSSVTSTIDTKNNEAEEQDLEKDNTSLTPLTPVNGYTSFGNSVKIGNITDVKEDVENSRCEDLNISQQIIEVENHSADKNYFDVLKNTVIVTPKTNVLINTKNHKRKSSKSATSEKEMDNETLIAILEGTADSDILGSSPLKQPDVISQTKPNRIRKRCLDPTLEKEIALKQLEDFDKTSKRKRSSTEFSKSKKLKINEPNNDVIGTETPRADVKKRKPTIQKFNSAPKRFNKKYQRLIKKQQKNNLKTKNGNAVQENQKKLPEVPEVQIAIDKYIKTYTNRRKQKPKALENIDTSVASIDNSCSSILVNDSSVLNTESEEVVENLEEKSKEISEGIIKENENKSSTEIINSEIEDCTEDSKEQKIVAAVSNNNADEMGILNTKTKREINRLLGDEGVVNMIYSIEQQKRTCRREQQPSPLLSVRKQRRALQIKTKEVKSLLIKGAYESDHEGVSRRSVTENADKDILKMPKEEPKKKASRKLSVDSIASNNSDTNMLADIVPADASKIIRRHSSSSSSGDDENMSEKMLEFNENLVSKQPPVSLASISSTSKCNFEPKTTTKHEKSIRQKSEGPKVHFELSKNVEHEDNLTLFSEPLEQLTVRKHGPLVQVVLTPWSSASKNMFSIQVLEEFISVLTRFDEAPNFTTILVTSTGNNFMQGIDLALLLKPSKEERLHVAQQYIGALKKLVNCLYNCKKLLIAGVHGSAVGLGVAILPFFDLVLASDKATFCTPYAKLGQVPEAGASVTLPALLPRGIAKEMLLGCRVLTASESLQFGLVNRVLWPDTFNEELLQIAKEKSSFSAQSICATKLLLNAGLYPDLENHVERESEFLIEHWCSDDCQNRILKYLQDRTISNDPKK